jgi:hypothetical protein
LPEAWYSLFWDSSGPLFFNILPIGKNMSQLSEIAGMVALFSLIGGIVYMSYAVEHLLTLDEGEKPSLWALPGVTLFGSLTAILTSAGVYRIFTALLM